MLTILLICLAVYAIGVLAMAAYLRFNNWPMAWMWPATLIWMFFGNIG